MFRFKLHWGLRLYKVVLSIPLIPFRNFPHMSRLDGYTDSKKGLSGIFYTKYCLLSPPALTFILNHDFLSGFPSNQGSKTDLKRFWVGMWVRGMYENEGTLTVWKIHQVWSRRTSSQEFLHPRECQLLTKTVP